MNDTVTTATNAAGSICTYNVDGELHSLNDRPSIKCTTGTVMWHKNNLLHRLGAPAVIFADGKCLWYTDGVKFDPKGWCS